MQSTVLACCEDPAVTYLLHQILARANNPMDVQSNAEGFRGELSGGTFPVTGSPLASAYFKCLECRVLFVVPMI